MSILDIVAYILFPLFYLFGSIKSVLLFNKISKLDKILGLNTIKNKIPIYITCVAFSWISYIALTDTFEHVSNH